METLSGGYVRLERVFLANHSNLRTHGYGQLYQTQRALLRRRSYAHPQGRHHYIFEA
jgi:hypothetical protein